MEATRRVPEASELVYVPEPSWLPLFTAAGIALALLGLSAGLAWTVVGGLGALGALTRWIRATGDKIAHMPREQKPVSAVLPPVSPAMREG